MLSLNAMFQVFISISSLVINEGSYEHIGQDLFRL
jgi:hypothetical protein